MKSIVAGLLLTGIVLACGGCRSDGPTTRLDYTYEKPIWTDAAYDHASSSRK